MRPLAIAAAVVALVLAGCGGDSAEDKRSDAGKVYCETLQKNGILLEPMSQCLAEYDDATREP